MRSVFQHRRSKEELQLHRVSCTCALPAAPGLGLLASKAKKRAFGIG
jgi:hypothetical protein